MTKSLTTELVLLSLGSCAILLGVFGYRAFAGHRSRRRYAVDNVSEQWLSEQRREP